MRNSRIKMLTMAAAVSIVLAGCSSDSDEATVKLSGVVADGYLQNATVCLDLNLNKACDADEPQALTNADGEYSFDADEAASAIYPVISVIKAGVTTDADFPSRALEAYVMSAPAGKPEFISPMTTMIQTEIESNPGLTPESAETNVKTNLGYSPTSTVSLFKDYVAAKDSSSTESDADKAEYERIHKIAQVTARTLEANHTLIQDAADQAGLDKDALLNELVRLVVKDVIANLDSITAAVDNGDGLDASGELDTATQTATSNIKVDGENLEDDLIAEQVASAAQTINIAALLSDGIHFLKVENNNNSVVNSEFGIEKITLDAAISADELQFSEEIWNGSAWVAQTGSNSDETRNCQAITATGLTTYGCDGAETIKDNGDGTAALESKDSAGNVIEQATIRGSKFDLAGQKIRTAAGFDEDGRLWQKTIPGNAIFSTGSTGYRWNFTSANDVYRVHYQEAPTGGACSDLDGSPTLDTTNCYSLHGQSGPVQATTLADVTDGATEYYVGNNMVATFTPDATDATMGDVSYIVRDYSTNPSTDTTIAGTYTIEQPMGGALSVLMFETPREFRYDQRESRDAKSFIVIDEGYARMGGFRPGGVSDPDDDMSIDAAAVADVKSCFMGGTVADDGTGSCSVQLFLNDKYSANADGTLTLNEPSIKLPLEFGQMVPFVMPTDTTLRMATNGSDFMRWTFALGTGATNGSGNLYGTGTLTPTELDTTTNMLVPKEDTLGNPKMIAVNWKVTTNGRLKIERHYTKSVTVDGEAVVHDYYDVWMVTQLDDDKIHVRFKRFNQSLYGKQEKNFGGYVTLLPAS